MTDTDNAHIPQIYTTRRLVGWHLLQSLDEEQRGDLLYSEAEHLVEKVKQEIGRQLPDHEVSPFSMLLEIGVQYIAD